MNKRIIFAVFALAFLMLSLLSMRKQSPTYDETYHIPAGYSYLEWGDFRSNPEHPPLVKLLAAFPLVFLEPKVSAVDPFWVQMGRGNIGTRYSSELGFGYEFLYHLNLPDRLVFWARVPIVLLAVLLGCVVGLWAWELYGAKAGCLALGLFLFTPELLAHGQLVTTDLGIACFLFLSVYTFQRALRQTTWKNLLLCGLVVGCAMVTKFSAAVIFPILFLLGLLYLRTNDLRLTWPRGGQTELTTLRGKHLALLGVLAMLVLTSVMMIWACYGFRQRLSPDPFVSLRYDWKHHWVQGGLARNVLQGIQEGGLLPEGFTLGFLEVLESTKQRPAFLHGQHSETGWWYYFLVTFVIKTPIPWLLLMALAFLFMRRYGAGWQTEAMLLLPVAVYWAVCLGSKLNIGNRHLLPVYPFLIVFAARLARAFEESEPRWLQGVLLVLLCWNSVETARVYPNFLTYFNQVAGGVTGGYQWLVDSNLDWGQGLKELAKYRQAHPEEPFYFAYFGSADPSVYGIQAKYLPGFNPVALSQPDKVVKVADVPSGAIVAVSATSLQCVSMNDKSSPGIEDFMRKLRGLTPLARPGNSIFVYRMP